MWRRQKRHKCRSECRERDFGGELPTPIVGAERLLSLYLLGRTLEKLYRAGPEGTFMRIAANAYNEYGGRFFHNDTTTMSLQGEYKHEEGDLDAVLIKIEV